MQFRGRQEPLSAAYPLAGHSPSGDSFEQALELNLAMVFPRHAVPHLLHVLSQPGFHLGHVLPQSSITARRAVLSLA